MTNNNKNIVTDSVCSCNNFLKCKTLHPLVSVASIPCKCDKDTIRLDSYAVFMRLGQTEDGLFGKNHYDFSDATLLFRQPSKEIDFNCKGKCDNEQGKMLMFNPKILCGNTLEYSIKDYSFFYYNTDEALHISCMESNIIKKCMEDIDRELQWGVDQYSATLICNKIEMLLNYCQRYYTRQFISRHDIYKSIITNVREYIDTYIKEGKIKTEGKPCSWRTARQFKMSTPYFIDMMKHETGKNFTDYVELRRIEIAKQMIIADKTDDENIADALGFCTKGCFRQLFRNLTGVSTDDYRK